MRVLIAEPWLGGSHAQWARGFQSASAHDVAIVGLPSDRWRWRLRGGAAPLAAGVRAWIAEHGRPDVVVVSSPVDAARLLGLLRIELNAIPVAAYQHESQLLYPNQQSAAANDESALHDWFSWLAADVVFFNSDWHRCQVIEALPSFVARFPDSDHHLLLDHVVDRFETLPLGVDLSWASPEQDRSDGTAPVIVWPHRWEPDKDAAAFVSAIDRLDSMGLNFRLVLAGEAGPFGDEERDRLVARHADRVLAFGPFSVEEYRHWLCRSDIVVSCARHDFFGVGIAEAVAAGCTPVVPNALHYPDLLGPTASRFTYERGTFGTRLAAVVSAVEPRRGSVESLRSAVRRYDWETMAPVYDARFEALAGRGPGDR